MKVFKRVGMNIEEIHEMLGEAILLSRLAHPNIVRVSTRTCSKPREGPGGYFTMETFREGPLQKFWQWFGTESSVPV